MDLCSLSLQRLLLNTEWVQKISTYQSTEKRSYTLISPNPQFFCPRNGNINNLHVWNNIYLGPWQVYLKKKDFRICRLQNQNVHKLHILFTIE